MATKKSGSWKDPKGPSKGSSNKKASPARAAAKIALDPLTMFGGTKAVVKGAMKAADWITPDFGSSKRAAELRKKYGSKAPVPRPKPSKPIYGPPAPKRTGQNQAGPRQMPKRIVDNMAAPRKSKPPTRTTKPAYKSSASKRQKGMQK